MKGKEGWGVTIPLNPVPASRPRVSKWGTYYLKTYATWKKEAEAQLKPYRLAKKDRFTGSVFVALTMVIKRPAKPTNPYPRGDIDNYEKAAYDAVTTAGVMWEDDVQIIHSVTCKRYADEGEEPHTYLHIEER